MQEKVAKNGWELTKVARIGRSRSLYGQKRVEVGVGQSRELKLSVCSLHNSAHPFLAKKRPGAPVFGHCPFIKSNGQNRVHPEVRWPEPGTPFHASPRPASYWPTPAQTRLWPNLKRVNPILATHPPIGYPLPITPTRLWPGYSTSSPHAHASWRHRGTRRVIFPVDVVVRAAEL